MVSERQLKLLFVLIMSVLQSCAAKSPVAPTQSSPTIMRTATFLPPNTPTATKSIAATPDDLATFNALQDASIQTLISTVQPVVLAEYPSGDGKWKVEIIRYDCINYISGDYKAIIAYEQVKLVNLNDGTETFVDEQPQACDGIGAFGFEGLYWSPNNRYFYYSTAREGYPDGSCGGYLSLPVYQLDTVTHETLMLTGGHISPDQTKLAMWEWQQPEIVIWDLDQGEVARVPSLEKVRFNGEISWSPDSQSLVYLQTEWDCAPDYGKTYLTRLNLGDMSQELLLQQAAPGFGRVHWGIVDQLILWDGDNREWTFDIPRKELKAPFSVTKTPVPSPTGPFDLSQMSVEEWSSTSPNGKWTAVGLVAFPEDNIGGQFAYVRLLIFSTDGKIHWTIIDEWQEMGLGFPIPSPLKWSQDGKHFYFTHQAIPDGCSVFPFITDLQQVNLENGSVEELLPDPAAVVAISPDESQVAYSYFYGQPELGLAVRDRTTGQERETKIDPGKDFNAGKMLWSPDGKYLALTLAINPCAGEYGVSKTVWAESTTIVLVDAETLQQKILIEEDPRLFITWEWNEPHKITITDGEENSIWHLDVNTGEITRP